MNKIRFYPQKRNVAKNNYDDLLSIKQVSEKYGVHPNTVYNWVHRDKLMHAHDGPGNKIFLRQNEVESFLRRYYPENCITKLP